MAKSIDFTALMITEVWEQPRPDAPPRRPGDPMQTEAKYVVQDLPRLPQGMNYRDQAKVIARYMVAVRKQLFAAYCNPHGFGGPFQLPPRSLFVDASGLGNPVTETIQERLADSPETDDVDVWPVIFTRGQRPYNLDTKTVGKVHLFRRLQALVAAERLDLPQDDERMPLLLSEIAAFHFELDQDTGEERMGGDAPAHDDLLCALALSVMIDPLGDVVRAIKFTWPTG